MAQQHLHHAQVCAMVEQVGGEGMAQRVRRQRCRDTRNLRAALDDDPEHHAAHRSPALGHEDRIAALPAQDGTARRGQIALQPPVRLLAEGHQPFLLPLARHAQHARAQIDAMQGQIHQLAHAQAAGIHQLQHGAVTQAQRRIDIGRPEQCLHLRLRQRMRHARRLPGRQHACRGIGGNALLAQRPVVVAAQHRQPPVGRTGLGLLHPHREIALQLQLARSIQRQRRLLVRQPPPPGRQIPAIGRQRIARQPVLQQQRIHEQVQRIQAGRQRRRPGCRIGSRFGFGSRWGSDGSNRHLGHPIKPTTKKPEVRKEPRVLSQPLKAVLTPA